MSLNNRLLKQDQPIKSLEVRSNGISEGYMMFMCNLNGTPMPYVQYFKTECESLVEAIANNDYESVNIGPCKDLEHANEVLLEFFNKLFT